MAFVGIDPGLDGAICFLPEQRGNRVEAFVTPTIPKGKGSGRLYDVAAMVRLLEQLRAKEPLYVALEKGGAMPGQGVTSMYRFGHGCGLWEGMLAALKLPHVVVHSRTWHKTICVGLTGEPKARAIMAASRAVPGLDLRKSKRATKPHSGKADAVCLAMHCRIHFFGERTEDAESLPQTHPEVFG